MSVQQSHLDVLAGRILSLDTDWIYSRGVPHVYQLSHQVSIFPTVDTLTSRLAFGIHPWFSSRTISDPTKTFMVRARDCGINTIRVWLISMESLLLSVSVALSQGTGPVYSWNLTKSSKEWHRLHSPVIRAWDLSILRSLWYCTRRELTCSFKQLPKS